jgi:hypothetical protein
VSVATTGIELSQNAIEEEIKYLLYTLPSFLSGFQK